MKRVATLDGIRGLAILFVLFWHYYCVNLDNSSVPALATIKNLFSFSWMGVDLFFVLSGYLITGILWDHRNAHNYYSVFYFRRACRILPIYFLILLSFFLLVSFSSLSSDSLNWLTANPMSFWSYATFTQNFAMVYEGTFGAHYLGVTWSLAVEEQFYILIPLIVRAASRRQIICILSFFIILAPILRYFSPGFQALILTPWRGDSLLSGALLAILMRDEKFTAKVRLHRVSILVGAVVSLLAVVVWSYFSVVENSNLHPPFAIFSCALIILALDPDLSRTLPQLFLKNSILIWLGKRSYGIYLFHQIMSGLLFTIISGSAPRLNSQIDFVTIVLALLATFVLAELSFRFVEKRFIEIGSRYKYAGGLNA